MCASQQILDENITEDAVMKGIRHAELIAENIIFGRSSTPIGHFLNSMI